MQTVPIRAVGEIGVVSDLSAQDVPLKGWNDAINLRFADGKVSRHSVFKWLDQSYTYAKQPVGIIDGSGTEGGEGNIVTVFSDGSMEQRLSGVTTSATPAGTLGVTTEQITTTRLGGVTYVNRGVGVPVYRASSGVVFQNLPDWGANDTCNALRSFKDYLVAFNVTKSGAVFPAMVKWSDATQAGVPPANWDVVDPASRAGETVLNDLRGGIIDGAAFGPVFIIYGETQCYMMEDTADDFVFRFSKLFDDKGVIARNCVAAVQGYHYVFGRNDIYMHDGVQHVSIADRMTLKRIYSEMDFDLRDRCFVYHDRFTSEIGFCYATADDSAQWRSTDVEGCNRAAVFNYLYKTWTFVDLPSVVASTENALSFVPTWGDLAGWDDQGGATWRSFSQGSPRSLILASTGNPTITKSGAPYYFDTFLEGRTSASPDPDLFWEARGEMTYKDLDDMGADLYGTKRLQRIAPQVFTNGVVTFELGSSNNLMSAVVWKQTSAFDPSIRDKIDTRVSGRYVALRYTIPAGTYAEMSGFDLTLFKIADR